MSDMKSKIMSMVKAGHKPKMAIASALAESRRMKKMAKGGAVEGDYDLDDEHERGLFDLMEQGDQPPVANPETQDMQKMLAMHLKKEDEANEYYAVGGLVEPMSGDEKPEVSHDGTEEPMSDEPEKPGHIEHMQISEEAMKAIAAKKMKRKFMK